MKTFYIVKHSDKDGPYWYAHKRGVLSFFGLFNRFNQVDYSYSVDGWRLCLYWMIEECSGKPFRAIQKIVYEIDMQTTD